MVALVLLGFLLVASGVIWRRSYGFEQARELQNLERRRLQLEATRVRLQAEVRDAASRARLAPIAERRLDMRIPTDSQVVILPRTATPDDSP